MPPDRVVSFRPRAVLSVLGVLLAVGIVLWVIYVAHQVISWMLISLFLALAINPAVERVQRAGVKRRGAAAGLVFFTFVVIVAAVAAAFVPTVVNQVTDFVDAIPGYVRDLTHGRGRLGFLETKYHVVERVQHAVNNRKGGGLLGGGAGTLLSVTKGIITGIVATVTIFFMTFFMLLEGPAWMERLYALTPGDQQQRWRGVARDIYRTVGGYVTGNLLISVIAGTSATVVLLILGVPFAVALGLLVAILDLIPLAGATLAAIVVSLVGLTHSLTAGIVLAVFFIVYQQLENHLLQPLVYGRTVQLSPLAVLIAVLIGAEVAGVLGALAAIPVAGTLQILLVDWQRERQRRRRSAVLEPDDGAPPGSSPAPQITAPAS